MIAEARKRYIIKLCQELLQKKSYPGEEGDVTGKLREAFLELGYDNVFLDEYGNIIGQIKGRRAGKNLLFDGHMDTVPVPEPEKWSHNPFGGDIVDGRIYGRGASDMKGALCAMVCAAGFFARDVDRNFAGNIFVAGVVHEECFEGVAARAISAKFKPDYVVIGEASELNLKRGQRGRAEIVVETYGKPAHSANPQQGINAVYKMTRIIDKIRGIAVPKHDFLGEGILELTDIKSTPYPGASVVPEYCRVTYDKRLIVGETPESVIQPIMEIIAGLEKEDPEFKAKAYFAQAKETCYTGKIIEGKRFFPGWLLEENDEFVQKAWAGLKEAGINPKITTYSFCTNGSHYAGEAGIKTIGFGPSRENLAHTLDEYIEINQLLSAAKGYYSIIKAVLN